MVIDNVKTIDGLDSVLHLVNTYFPPSGDSVYKCSRDFWIERMNERPELLLYAKDDGAVSGTVLAWVDNGSVTVVVCCVDEAYRGRGVGRALMLEI